MKKNIAAIQNLQALQRIEAKLDLVMEKLGIVPVSAPEIEQAEPEEAAPEIEQADEDSKPKRKQKAG